MRNPQTCQQIGELFFETGLADIFGIQPNENLKLNPDHKTSLLFGFLKEAAEGNLEDPKNIHKWETTGEALLKS